MAAKYLKEESLLSWLEELGKSQRTLVPCKDGDAIVFRPFDKEKGITFEREATTTPKQSIFPKCETLFTYKYEKDPETPAKVSLKLNETVDAGPTVVVGCRPCDARGFNIFDRVYDSEKVKDKYYVARRQQTAFVSLVCTEVETTCFCNWTGEGPADPAGSDVLMIPVDGGYVLEAVSEKGEKLLGSSLLEDAGAKTDAAAKVKEDAKTLLPAAPDITNSPAALFGLFDNKEFWEEMSDKCLSCGACTYLCPTCYCFNITDEAYGDKGARLRTWDSCMMHMFTMEASGHNPRSVKANRLKNRVGHKFSYYPTAHEGIVSCCGCGRCVKSCPAGIDIREIVKAAVQNADACKA